MRAPALLAAAAAAALAGSLAAQPTPRVAYLYPAGGRQGTTVQVRAGGQYLNGASRASVSGGGVEVKSAEFVKPPTASEIQFLREEMQQLNRKRAEAARQARPGVPPRPLLSEAERKRVEEIRDKLEDVQRRRNIPAMADQVLLEVTIAPDAATGPRELRLETPNGLTPPILFAVGDLPEISREPARVGPLYNVINGGVPTIRTAPRQADPPVEVKLPVVVNGQMMPGVSDRYRFRAAQGQHLVIAVEARALIPYLSDAVPGWFQAAITLRDAEGRELASADHFRFHPDPMLEYDIPGDGEYVAEIRDAIYRGREDFVYRMSMGELPVLTGVFPLGAKAGTRATVAAAGWNLPAPRLRTDLRGKPAGTYAVAAGGAGRATNRLPFAVDTLPETTAKPGIGRREKAQRVKPGVIVNGRIAQPGEVAYFRFEGRAGEEIAAEVLARRLGSPVDSMLRLLDASGKELAANDDYEDRGAGLLTHQADSFLLYRLRARGTYYLQLSDAQHNGGPEYAYRLRISHPRPDFALRVVPSSLNLRGGSTAAFTVYAIRKDGFSGDITLKLKDTPADFVLSGAAIPSGQDKVRVTLTVPRNRAGLPSAIGLSGQATIEGREVAHGAVAAEDMEQAFAYHHLVPEDAWMVRVTGAGGAALAWRPVAKPVALRAGATTAFEMSLPIRLPAGVQLALNDPPEGIAVEGVNPARNGATVVVRVRTDKAKPGLKGNLILEAFREVASNAKAGNRARRQAIATLPAVPFEVVGPVEAARR